LRWHHCAIVARAGERDPLFYVDGQLRPVTGRDGKSTIVLSPSTSPLYVGAQLDIDSASCYFGNCIIDELSIYNRALSPAEIIAIYKAGRAGKLAPSENPSLTRLP
jgi:hypothetical protein